MQITIDWILVNELAIGQAPSNDIDIELLRKNRIKTIISLCYDSEDSPPKGIESTFKCLRYPLPDHRKGTIPKIEDILHVLHLIKKNIKNGPIYIHCLAGMERSPLICLGWLIKEKGYSLQVALDYIMQMHPGTSPLGEQLKLLTHEKFKSSEIN